MDNSIKPTADDIRQLRRIARDESHGVLSADVDRWRENGWLIRGGWTLTDRGLHVALSEVPTPEVPRVPVPMILTCPAHGCGARHVDKGDFATKPHHTHACQHCGHVWRPAIVPTVGVQFLPGFKDEEPAQ